MPSSRVGLWVAAMILVVAAPLRAQVCSGVSGGPLLGFDPGAAIPGNPALNCNPFRCHDPILSSPEYVVVGACQLGGATPCTVQGRVESQWPGNDTNPSQFGSPARIEWRFSSGSFAGACGSLAGALVWETGDAWVQVGGFRCDPLPTSSHFDVYQMTAISCPGLGGGCQRTRVTSVDMTAPTLEAQLCPPPPPPWSCGEGDSHSCSACTGVGGGISPAGGGPSIGDRRFGPGTQLRYLAGGAGHVAHPKPSWWTAQLGRSWSLDYFEAIVPFPDAGHVFLLTRHATFREFFDADSDGAYETAIPSDEYRRLEKTPSGWELRSLDGTVDSFGNDGRWTQRVDRNGNTKAATYSAGFLTSVTFPDGRREDFGYTSGRLTSIVEVGVGGADTRTWALTWAGNDLMRLDRPDGTAFEFFYHSTLPGYLERYELVGTDGSRRVEEAWSYDARGNVTRNWKGDTSFTGPNAVAKWQLVFDDPAEPTETTVTDPLGTVATYTIERDPGSTKPRIAQVEGDCPVCGLGPNSQSFYEDPQNPLRPTRQVDGRGITTLFEWDEHGQMTSKVEAWGTALEREARYEYDANFPALPTLIEQPSTTGNPLEFRRKVITRDPLTGDALMESEEGFEDGAPFSYPTVTTYNGAGMPLTVDPPGYGTADMVSMTYDATRGDLVMLTRTEPLIGTMTYVPDSFNRTEATIDVNGVSTEMVFDPLDRPRFTLQRGATPAEDLITEHRYDPRGDLFQTVLPRGNVIEHGYDLARRLTTVERKPDDQPTSHGERVFFTLNGFGQQIREEQQRWEGSWVTKAVTERVYTNRCQLQKVVQGAGSATPSTTEYGYDCEGNLDRVWDANHPSANQTAPPNTRYFYDDLNRLEMVTQPWGGAGGGNAVTSYEYDVQDHLTQVTDAEGGVTRYTFSDRDLLTREESEVSGITTHGYNEHGQLVTQQDARGVVVSRTVDELDRVTFTDYPDDGLDVTHAYDDPLVPFSKGRLTKITRNGHEIAYGWDRWGRMTRDGALGYVLDANGNREEIEYPGGVIARYTHDYADREATLEVEVPGEPVQTVVSAASYLPTGPLEQLTLGNGLTETHLYDPRYFPDRITVAGGTPLLNWDYTVDAVGNPTAIADVLAAGQSRAYGYQDFQYYLTLGNGPWGNLSWTHDRIGNRLTETRGGVNDVYSYVPNLAGGRTAKLAQIQLGAGGTRVYGFDAAGNQSQVSQGGDVVVMSHDDANLLAALDRPSAGVGSDFLYDGRGFLRHAAEVEPDLLLRDGFETGNYACWSAVVGGPAGGVCPGPPRVEPLYSSEGMLHYQLKEGGVERIPIYFAGRPVATATVPVVGAVQWRFLSADHLGTPILATTGAGAVSWSGGFEPFGRDYAGAGVAGVYLRFPGQWEDEAWHRSTLDSYSYNVYRWYSQGAGRYDRPDPISNSKWSNVFSYVDGNPLSYYDSLGLHKEGGPWHPDRPIACKISDSCAEIRHKISQFSHAIAAHRQWDRVRGVNRHAGEIKDFINGIEHCKHLFKIKSCDQPCKPCKKIRELSPVLIAGYIIYKIVEIVVCPALVPVTP